METFDRIDDFLLRAQREDRAAQRATSIEARLSHQRLAMHLRHAVARFGLVRATGGREAER
jgi:hypothetical protein